MLEELLEEAVVEEGEELEQPLGALGEIVESFAG